MRKFRFHLLGLVHLPCSREYTACAFTQKNYKLSQMLMSLGHEVFYYGAEKSDLPCTKFFQTHTLADISKEWGDGDNRFDIGYDWKNSEFRHDFNKPVTATTKKYYSEVISVINKIKKPNDFLLITQGRYQKPIDDNIKLYLTAESGIGYRGSYARFRAFESTYIQNFTYGSEHPYASLSGNYYDRVIPNSFTEDEVLFNPNPDGDYFLYVGRIIKRKGILTAIMTCKELGKKLLIAGQNGVVLPNGNFADKNRVEFEVDPSTWQYVGFLDIESRKKMMSNAIALFSATEYLEPFAGSHVESMLCGTPVITTNFGVFPDTVINGVNGYRCNTLNDFVVAAKNIATLDRSVVRKNAERFLTTNIKWEYNRWFDDLYDVWESTQNKNIKGWSRIRTGI